MASINFTNITLYDWVPFFTELSNKIAEIGNQTNKNELLKEKSIECFGVEAAINVYQFVDPFSFLYFLAQRNTTHNRADSFNKVKSVFNLQNPVPSDTIFPTPPPHATVLFHNGVNFETELLWSLFMEASSGSQISNGKFISAMGINGVKSAKLTQTLFLINSRNFIPIDDRTLSLPIFSNANLKSVEKEVENLGLQKYQPIINQIRNSFPGCELYEVNLFAYLLFTGNLKLSDIVYQISSNAYDDGDNIESFFERNSVWTGGSASSDNDGGYTYPVTEPKPGDIMVIRTGNWSVRCISVVLENGYTITDGWTDEGEIKILRIAADNRSILDNKFTRKEALNKMRTEKIEEVRKIFPESFRIIDSLTGKHENANRGMSTLAIDFEKLSISLLEYYKLNVSEVHERGAKFIYDFSVVRSNKKVCVEVKLYRSNIVPPETLRRACAILNSVLNNESVSLLLIVSSEVREGLKKELLEKYKVHIWDIRTLFHMSIDISDIYHSLSTIFVKATNQQVGDLSIVDVGKPNDYVEKLFEFKPPINTPKLEVDKKGAKLCEELKQIAKGSYEDYDSDTGKTSFAKLYEDKCTEILKYLFEEDLDIWSTQNYTDGNLHIFDLVCRISSQHNFWIDLSKDFNTRYVIFEFKNYSHNIKQGQIYTTEKYLFITALRSVGFIISRLGPDRNAQIAAKGALRENGKLIVNLTDSDLCKMLKLKDDSSDHTEVLINIIDEILTKITR